MASAFTVTCPTGSASFESVIRSWDESPRDAFSAKLVGEPILYGIWQPRFDANENDFNVEILGFGWNSKNSVGHPSPLTRTKLSSAQATDIKGMIIALFNDADARRRIVPFSTRISRFLGGIDFKKGWILVKE